MEPVTKPKKQLTSSKKVILNEVPGVPVEPVRNNIPSSSNIQNIPSTSNIPKRMITREEFEKMGSKETIINWMLENMDPRDILSCLQGNEYSSDYSVNNLTDEIGNMELSDISEVIQEISFEDLIDQINDISDDYARYERIIEMCTSAGVFDDSSDVGVVRTKKNVKLVLDDKSLSDTEIRNLLKNCATKEANRLALLAKREKMY